MCEEAAFMLSQCMICKINLVIVYIPMYPIQSYVSIVKSVRRNKVKSMHTL